MATTKNSGESREVELEFTQDTTIAGDPWLATLSVATQEAVALSGTIRVVLDRPETGEKYSVGTADTSTVTVNDISIPELSIAYTETETLGGKDAMFEVTSDIPFVGDLAVTYQPEKSGGNFLNETDGASGGPNTNSGVDRSVTLRFVKDGDAYNAPLLVATVEDASESDNTGNIEVVLQDDPEVTDSYTVSSVPGENTATASVINVPIPVLTVVSNSITVTTDEGTAARYCD